MNPSTFSFVPVAFRMVNTLLVRHSTEKLRAAVAWLLLLIGISGVGVPVALGQTAKGADTRTSFEGLS